MSDSIRNYIWRSNLDPEEKLVMLAFATYAYDSGFIDSGFNLSVPVWKITCMTGYPKEQVRKIKKGLLAQGLLIRRKVKGMSEEIEINVSTLMTRIIFDEEAILK